MSTDQLTVNQAIQNAREALLRGDKRTARRWAVLALSSAPELEAPWLILASVASPRASIAYLEQALKINPESAIARQGLRWAKKRLATSEGKPTRSLPHQRVALTERSLTTNRSSFLLLFFAFACLVLAWAAWPGSASPAYALIAGDAPSGGRSLSWSLVGDARPASASMQIVLGDIQSASPTPEIVLPAPTSTPAAEPTDPPTPAPTAEPSTVWLEVDPTPTEAVQATEVAAADPNPTEVAASDPAPTEVAVPDVPADNASNNVYTVRAGDTLSSIAVRFGVSVNALITANAINNPSVIHTGQQLVIPTGGAIAQNNDVPPATTYPSGEKRVIVDISEQHLYAYEGDALVYSFVASTGMNNATRVGTFRVLDKIPNAYGATWNIWMPNWLGIYWAGSLENGIHALPILSNGQRLWAGYLGTPISYGCVVLGVQESQLLYNWVDVGTPVIIQW
jgi:LysM repeat protein